MWMLFKRRTRIITVDSLPKGNFEFVFAGLCTSSRDDVDLCNSDLNLRRLA